MLLFGKKEPERMPGGKGAIPVEKVKELASKGFSEPDMIDVLRREGYSPDEIDRALSGAVKSQISAPQAPGPQLPTLEQLQPEPPQVQMPQVPETSLPENYYYDNYYYQQPQQPQQLMQQNYPTEEYVEYLVRERMGDVNQKINEFIVRYQELEKRMVSIYEQLESLAKTKTTEEQLILSKIDSFRDIMNDVEIRLGSLEKAFKDTLPALIESVRALCDLVQRFKREA